MTNQEKQSEPEERKSRFVGDTNDFTFYPDKAIEPPPVKATTPEPEPSQIKMAKASQSEIDNLREVFQQLEDFIEDGHNHGETEEWLYNNREKLNGWRRLIEGYEVLISNACDPDKDYLEWKPELLGVVGNDN